MSHPAAVAALCAIAWTAAARADTTTMNAPAMVITSRTLPQAQCRPLKPIPPDQAIALGMTGTVRVEYTVEADGRVHSVDLGKSTAHPVLGEAVRAWLEGCPHQAAARAGKSISLRVAQLFVFKP